MAIKFTNINYPQLMDIKRKNIELSNIVKDTEFDDIIYTTSQLFNTVINNPKIDYLAKTITESMRKNDLMSLETKNQCILSLEPTHGYVILEDRYIYIYKLLVQDEGILNLVCSPIESSVVLDAFCANVNGYSEDGGLDLTVGMLPFDDISSPLYDLPGVNEEHIQNVSQYRENIHKSASLRILDFLVFKQMIETETILLNKKTNPKKKINKNVYVNKLDVDINIIDSTWYREILRTESFGVRGHLRLQRYGEGRKQIKVIPIKPYIKNGYHRKAGKQLHEEKYGEIK